MSIGAGGASTGARRASIGARRTSKGAAFHTVGRPAFFMVTVCTLFVMLVLLIVVAIFFAIMIVFLTFVLEELHELQVEMITVYVDFHLGHLSWRHRWSWDWCRNWRQWSRHFFLRHAWCWHRPWHFLRHTRHRHCWRHWYCWRHWHLFRHWYRHLLRHSRRSHRHWWGRSSSFQFGTLLYGLMTQYMV